MSGPSRGVLLESWIAVVAVVAGLRPVFLEGQAAKPLTLWLPYASGSSAQCAQGAMSGGSHRGLHAWDFMLAGRTRLGRPRWS